MRLLELFSLSNRTDLNPYQSYSLPAHSGATFLPLPRATVFKGNYMLPEHYVKTYYFTIYKSLSEPLVDFITTINIYLL